MLQDGHFKEVYMCAFHPDGSLVGTGDLSGIGQIWDLRSGKVVYTMQGHVKRIVCGDFSPNGFQVGKLHAQGCRIAPYLPSHMP